VLKIFFRWFFDEEKTKEFLGWVKLKKPKNELTPVDLLTEEEMLKMINACRNPRDRCIISIFAETGCRCGELLNLKIKDVQFGEKVSFLVFDGKTGRRQCPILFSVPYIQTWLQFHKRRDDINSPLFINYDGKPIKRRTIEILIKNLANKCGIKKRVYPHLFRHSRATILASKWPEVMLKKYMGWTGDSRMTATYTHLSTQDLVHGILEMNGFEPKKEEDSKLKPRKCFLCGELNTHETMFCKKCGRPLEKTAMMEELEKMERYADFFKGMMKLVNEHPELKELLERVLEKEINV
jgi:integrase